MIQNILEYSYINAGPHAVTGLTNTTGTLLPAFDQTVDYTAFNKASFISQGDYSYYITYDPDRQRSKTILNQSPSENTIFTKYYAFGDYEKEITEDGTRHLHYIAGGDGLAAIYVKYDNAPDEMYFILKDHLGSITGAINSETGIVYRQNFDAWGRRRNPVDWSYSNIPDFPFDRGYTGHEHLKWFGLINMNGRMYDAALGRFLSPDLIVQNPTNTQNYNRYSYCLNNPLKYVDPSGYYRAGNSGDWWAGGDGPVFYFQGYGQAIPSGIGPGSGNHWSDYTRREFNNYLLSNNRSFDYMKGPGSANLGYEMYKNPILRELWANGDIDLDYVRKNSLYNNQIYEITFNPDQYDAGVIVLQYDDPWASDQVGHEIIPLFTTCFINPQGGGINWSEVGSSGVGLALGIAEVVLGVSGELLSGGLSTAVIIDGGIRMISNGGKLKMLLTGSGNIAVTTPSNAGGWIGKGVDMATGLNYNEIGLGQGVGSFTNDFSTFVITGGNALNLSKMVSQPTLINTSSYWVGLFGTPYGAQSDGQNWYKYKRK